VHVDDKSIDDADLLYRRIATSGDRNMLVIDEQTGEIGRVSSGAFALDEDGCSVYSHAALAQHDLGPNDVSVAPQNLVVSVTAAEARTVHLGVRPDPWPAGHDGHIRNAAHALIVNPSSLGDKKLRTARRFLAAAAQFCVTP
jgi:hypothetical protein